MNETSLMEDKNLRDQCMERLEVLDRVKQLVLMPQINMMTVKQVADYYMVPSKTINDCYRENKDEIGADGACRFSPKELKVRLPDYPETKNGRGFRDFKLSEDVTLRVPNAGILLFPKRAILRIGMLLRDSAIAREVRTQLLNAFEHTDDVAKTADINEEQTLLMGIATAYATGDIMNVLGATMNLDQFRQRHINAITESNKMLTAEILRWDDRDCINKAVRILGSKSGAGIGAMWRELYNELRYKHGIGLSQRGKAPYIQHVRKDEWPLIQQSLSALCEKYEIEPSYIFERAKINT